LGIGVLLVLVLKKLWFELLLDDVIVRQADGKAAGNAGQLNGPAHGFLVLVGVGGGSVMDCCKAVSLAARYQGDDLWADFFAQPGVIDFEPLPLGIIVTERPSQADIESWVETLNLK
jgi:hypothetical protein